MSDSDSKNHSHKHSHDRHHDRHSDHGHLHGVGGHHHHSPMNYDKAFAIGISLNILFVVIEASYGVMANSLALLADAGHNLSDVLGLIVAWFATYLVRKKPSHEYTYGLRSSSILAALLNALFLLVAMGGVVWEAIGRFRHPPEVAGSTVIVVAIIGIAVNGVSAYLFSSGHKDDLNIKGAYLHLLADALVSVGVAVAGVVMIYTKWNWLDPLVSILVSLIILKGTWDLLKESLRLAMGAVPLSIDRAAVFEFIKSKKEVSAVHDLHIWGMSTTENALTAHVVTPSGHPGDSFLHHLSQELKEKFKINHSTIQIEIGNDTDHACELEPDDVV